MIRPQERTQRVVVILTAMLLVLASVVMAAETAAEKKTPGKPTAAKKAGEGKAAGVKAADKAKADDQKADEKKVDEKAKDEGVDIKDMVPLKVDLPKAAYTGTPKNIRSDNLEEPRKPGEERKMPLVPKGTENLALKKKVTSSDQEPIIGDPELITDGDKEAKDGCFVEFGPGRQWVQVDLGQESNIYAILLWHYHSEGRVYRDVIVQVSDDPDFASGVKTVFNNDHDHTAGLVGVDAGKNKEYIESAEGKLIECKDVKARYVRFYSSGNTSNDMNHYTEVEVYGTPVAK
jgi:hypothetical protein